MESNVSIVTLRPRCNSSNAELAFWVFFFKMATENFLRNVMEIIEKDIYKELYIFKSDKLLKLHNFVKESMLENDILPVYISIFENLRQNCRAGVDFTFTVYSDCGIARDTHKNYDIFFLPPDHINYVLFPNC